jgi:hypothetical protein
MEFPLRHLISIHNPDVHDESARTDKSHASLLMGFCSEKLIPGFSGDPFFKRLGFDSRRGLGIFYSPPRPERLWDPPSLLSSGCQGLVPWG